MVAMTRPGKINKSIIGGFPPLFDVSVLCDFDRVLPVFIRREE